jgi:hypothetical protein
LIKFLIKRVNKKAPTTASACGFTWNSNYFHPENQEKRFLVEFAASEEIGGLNYLKKIKFALNTLRFSFYTLFSFETYIIQKFLQNEMSFSNYIEKNMLIFSYVTFQ